MDLFLPPRLHQPPETSAEPPTPWCRRSPPPRGIPARICKRKATQELAALQTLATNVRQEQRQRALYGAGERLLRAGFSEGGTWG